MIRKKYGEIITPTTVVLLQELERFNKLIKRMSSSLSNLQKVCVCEREREGGIEGGRREGGREGGREGDRDRVNEVINYSYNVHVPFFSFSLH